MLSSRGIQEELIEKLDLSEEDPKISFSPERRTLVAEQDEYLRDKWFEGLLLHVGGTGRWQWCLFLITSSSGIICGFHAVASAFIAATPEHWCHVDILDSINGSHDLRNGSVPWEVVWDEMGEYSSCSYYDRNWTDLVASGLSVADLPFLPTVDVPTRSCHKWVYDHSIYETTVVEEWNLVCGNKYRKSLIQSMFMVGILVGGVVFSEVSDNPGGNYSVSATATLQSPPSTTKLSAAADSASSPAYMSYAAFAQLPEIEQGKLIRYEQLKTAYEWRQAAAEV